MAAKGQVYRCGVCGNIVEVLHGGAGQLVCCGQPMELLAGKSEGTGEEKHRPIAEKTETGIRVKVGSIPHPMEEKHYIEWVEVVADGEVHRRFLKPGEKPEVDFPAKAEKVKVRSYCNLHGLWESEA